MARYQELLLDSILRVKDYSGYSREEILDVMNLRYEDYLSFSTGSAPINDAAIQKLCGHFRIDYDDFILNDVDYIEFGRKFHKGQIAFPERYAKGQSHIVTSRMIMGIIECLSQYFGYRTVRSIFKSVNLKPAAFLDPRLTASAFLADDIFSAMPKFINNNLDFYMVGEESFGSRLNHDAHTEIANTCYSPSHLYQMLHDYFHSKYTDRLFHYRLLSLKKDKLTMEIVLRDTAKEQLNQNHFGNDGMCRYIAGNYRSTVYHIGYSKVPRLLKSSCMYQGDKTCTFHLSWPDANFISPLAMH